MLPAASRRRPHSYHSALSVEVGCPVDRVYDFMRRRIPDVYLDFEALAGDRTRLTQTVVVDMLNPVFKIVADVAGLFSGDRKMWDEHFREELDGYRNAIERDCAGSGRGRPGDGEGP